MRAKTYKVTLLDFKNKETKAPVLETNQSIHTFPSNDSYCFVN